MAEKQGEIRSGEGGKEILERGVTGVEVPAPVMMSGHDNPPRIKGSVAEARADVEKDGASPANVCIKNPDSSPALNFEQQLKEIDDAINGSVSDLNSVTNQETCVEKENNTQVMHMTMMDRDDDMHVSGLNVDVQAHSTMLGPQDTLQQPTHESKAISGLIQSGIHFSLGLSSPKQQPAQGVKKNRGGNQKKNRENRGVSGKENKSGSEESQCQGDKHYEDSTMEIEKVDMGIKRRARTPLSELENQEDNGKRIKREGEVKELGKLLAQHLGSAEAAMQLRRA